MVMRLLTYIMYVGGLFLLLCQEEDIRMGSLLFAYAFSAGAVVLAEMGDKTQLLAMAFATKYKAWQVMIGVFVATIFNHALAVLVGHLIAGIEPAQVWIQGIAALAFIGFGLWTIRGDSLDGEHKKPTKFGPIITVTIAFFIAEMGDKTQLATIALATKFDSPVAILMGTTTGMLIADAIGIIVGIVLAKKIPERKVKLVSAGAFMLFGFIASYQVLSGMMHLPVWEIILIMVVLAAVTGLATWLLVKRESTATSINEIE